MNHQKETSKDRRKRMRETNGRKYVKEDHEDWTSVDYFSLGHIVGRMGWKGTGLLIIFMIVGYVIYKMV